MSDAPRNLIERTFEFARRVRRFANSVPRTNSNIEDIRQLVRSSGSVAANYLESQEGVSRKDFFYRIKLCRKEARESGLWVRLIDPGENPPARVEQEKLFIESEALKRIFSSIAVKDDTA